jgi:hypothetical protein
MRVHTSAAVAPVPPSTRVLGEYSSGPSRAHEYAASRRGSHAGDSGVDLSRCARAHALLGREERERLARGRFNRVAPENRSKSRSISRVIVSMRPARPRSRP